MANLMARPDDTALLIIDVQDFFLDGWMSGASEPLLVRIEYLFALAAAYKLPIMATFEEPVEKKGRWPARLEPSFPAHGQTFTKHTFGCCNEAPIAAAIAALPQTRIAVAGGETDVCVLQSVLGLIDLGKTVVLLEDALFSEEPNVGPALRRMEAAGAIPGTVKTLHYELQRAVGPPSLAERLAQRGVTQPVPQPEDLPDWTPSR